MAWFSDKGRSKSPKFKFEGTVESGIRGAAAAWLASILTFLSSYLIFKWDQPFWLGACVFVGSLVLFRHLLLGSYETTEKQRQKLEFERQLSSSTPKQRDALARQAYKRSSSINLAAFGLLAASGLSGLLFHWIGARNSIAYTVAALVFLTGSQVILEPMESAERRQLRRNILGDEEEIETAEFEDDPQEEAEMADGGRQWSEFEESPESDAPNQASEDPILQPSDSRPWYVVLGVQPHATPEELKTAWRSAISQYHPDRVASLGIELRELAEKKTKEINAAYDEGQKQVRTQRVQ